MQTNAFVQYTCNRIDNTMEIITYTFTITSTHIHIIILYIQLQSMYV